MNKYRPTPSNQYMQNTTMNKTPEQIQKNITEANRRDNERLAKTQRDAVARRETNMNTRETDTAATGEGNAPRIDCPSCGRKMAVGRDGIAGDFTAQCRNKKCNYDGWSADSLEQLIEREIISPLPIQPANWEDISETEQDSWMQSNNL